MARGRSRLVVGVGVLCFVGMLALWLAPSKNHAIADSAPVVTALTQAMTEPLEVDGVITSRLHFAQRAAAVHRLSVYVNLQSPDARALKIFLTSPSGTKVLIADGASSSALKRDGLEGWFGADGLQTAESFAVFAGEPVTGDWQLSIDARQRSRLVRWNLTVDVTPYTASAGMDTYGEYTSGGGCDCRVVAPQRCEDGLAVSGLLLVIAGLALLVRRRRS
jgi:subtilisin-like proprotein convertase family protein